MAAIRQQPNSARSAHPCHHRWPSELQMVECRLQIQGESAIWTQQSAMSSVLEEHSMSDRQYELVYILPPDTTEQQVAELHSQVEAVVSRMHGQIATTQDWGPERLAYGIRHNEE